MDLQYQQHIPADFHENSKVWVYQSNRLLSIGEALGIEDILKDFIAGWESHGSLIKGYANLFFGQFIVLMADDSTDRLCGSSADKSIRMIKEIEQKFNVNLLDRQNLGFIVKDKVEILPLTQLSYALENGFIGADTLYFNNLVTTKKMLLNDWLIPVKNSWLKTRLPNLVP